MIFDGNPLEDIRLLGEKNRFQCIIKDGNPIDLDAEIPDSWQLPGWRVGEFSSQVLTQDLVKSLVGEKS